MVGYIDTTLLYTGRRPPARGSGSQAPRAVADVRTRDATGPSRHPPAPAPRFALAGGAQRGAYRPPGQQRGRRRRGVHYSGLFERRMSDAARPLLTRGGYITTIRENILLSHDGWSSAPRVRESSIQGSGARRKGQTQVALTRRRAVPGRPHPHRARLPANHLTATNL